MRLNEVAGYDKMVYFLLKFSRYREHLEVIRCGNVYMDRFLTYVEQEKKERKKGQGDSLEASILLHFLNAEIRDPDSDKILYTLGENKMSLTPSGFLNRPVFCTMAIDASMLVIMKEYKDHFEVKVEFSDEQKKLLPEIFGRYVLSIEFTEFLAMFHEWFQKLQMPLIAGLVNYEDLSINSKYRLELFNNEDPRLFLIKSDAIAYQNEYRFVPYNLEVSEPMIVNLGDMSSITEMHNSVELLNKDIILKVAKVL